MGRSLDERGPVDTYHRFGRTPDYTTSPYSLILHTAFLRTPDDISHHPLILITTLGEPLITLLHLIPCYFTPVCANPWLHFITLFVVTSHQFVWTPDYTTSPYSLILRTSLGEPLIALLHLILCYFTLRTPDYTFSPYSLLLHTSLCEPLITLLHLIRWYLTPLWADPWLHCLTFFVDTWHRVTRWHLSPVRANSWWNHFTWFVDTWHGFARHPLALNAGARDRSTAGGCVSFRPYFFDERFYFPLVSVVSVVRFLFFFGVPSPSVSMVAGRR